MPCTIGVATCIDADEANLEDPIKEATFIALKRILEPLLGLMLDAGVTVQEFNSMVRERSVRVASRRVMSEIGRVSKSRIAIMTGLPRSEVSKILNSQESVKSLKPSQQPARRVLAAWHDNPKFGAPSGEPAILPIFGKGRSFERLVDSYGGGIPVRAMLDELTQINAVERLPDQKVRVKVRVPILTGLTSRSITAVGERGKDLFETLTSNLKQSRQPLFEATAIMDEGDPETASLVRREITDQGTTFINGATSLFNRLQRKRNSKQVQLQERLRLGVTIFYFQDNISSDEGVLKAVSAAKRKNLRRRTQKPKETNSGSQVK